MTYILAENFLYQPATLAWLLAKVAASFYSGRWNTDSNPDLAIASVGPYSRLLDRSVFKKFSSSQH